MASFRLFADKENASSVNVTSRQQAGALSRGPVGKTFQSSQLNGAQATPMRKALSVVNSDSKTGGGQLRMQMVQKIMANIAGPAAKPPQAQPQEQLKPTFKKPAAKPVVKAAPVVKQVEEIEQAYIQPELEDDFDDIWPIAEQPITYLKQLKEWRPFDLFPVYSDSDDESDTSYAEDSGYDLFSSCLTDHALKDTHRGDIEFEPEPTFSLGLIDLPPLDEHIPDDLFVPLNS